MKYLTDITYKAGAYLRLSIEDENKDTESISIQNQREFIKNYAKKNNIEIYDYYVDDGYSGGNFDRPSFQRMINDIENGKINCVITKDMSRLGREFIETGNYIYKYFPEHDIRYIAILENYDTLTPSSADDVLPFKAVINDMYLKDLSKKIKSVRHEKMKKGEFVNSVVPYGYKRSKDNNKVLEINEETAPIVKRIFEMYAAGKKCSEIASILTKNGILPPFVYSGRKLSKTTITSNIWKDTSIRTILQNKAYIGTLIQGKYGRVSLKSKKKKILPESQWVVVPNALPRIINDDLFNKVNSPTKRSLTRHAKYDYLLKGLVYCADCGKPMLVRKAPYKNDGITPIFVCKTYANYGKEYCSMHYFREEDLNKIVINELRNVLSKYSSKDEMEKTYNNTLNKFNMIDEWNLNLKKLKEKIVVVDKAISDLYKDRSSGIISLDDFTLIKTNLLNDKKNYERDMNDLLAKIDKSKKLFNDDKTKKKYISDFLNIKSPNKQMIDAFINRIEVNNDKSIKIYYNYNFGE